MAQAQGSESRLVLADELTYKAAPELVIENCEDAWNETVDSDVTATLENSDKKVGSGSAKFVVAAGASAGDLLATEAISIASLASYTHIAMWIKSTVALSAGDLQLLLDNTASCASPLETLNVPAVTANTWTQVRMALANPATDVSLISVGIKMVVDKGAFTFYLDDIRAINEGRLMPFLSESLRMSRNLITSNVIRSSRNPNQPARGNYEVGGDIVTEFSPFMGLLLKHALGSYARTGAGPYTHTFKIGSLPTGLQVEKQFSDIAKYFLYNGCKVNSFGLTIKPEGMIEARFGLMGAKETVGDVPYDNNGTDPGHTPFDGFEAAINRGGASLGIGTEVSFTIENNLDGSVYVVDGTGQRYSLPAGKAKVTGTLTALFEDTTLYDLAVNHTETSLQIVLTKGTGDGSAGNEKCTFNFDEIIFKPQAPVVQGPQGIMVELSFEAYYNNDADASALWVELINANASL